MHHSQKKKLTDTVPQEIQTMELPKTAYAQRTKETKKTISQQMENSNKETEIIKSNDTWELKSTKTEMKNSLEWYNSISEQRKEIVNFEDRKKLSSLRNRNKKRMKETNTA